MEKFYLILADIVQLVHFAFVLFVVLGQAFILVGKFRGWRWVRNPWFRSAHLAAIGIVAVQAWLGRLCPLTIWENSLREAGGGAAYEGSFVAHWISRIMYFEVPFWVFTIAYSLFGALVLFSWFWVRPQGFRSRRIKTTS